MADPQRQDEKPGSSDPAPAKPGWVEGLAKRSTGLPDDTKKVVPAEKNAWSYAGLGLQFAGTTALFALMGMYLDHRMGWSPWGTVGLTMLGLIGGLYLLIKESLKENAGSRPGTKEPPRS